MLSMYTMTIVVTAVLALLVGEGLLLSLLGGAKCYAIHGMTT